VLTLLMTGIGTQVVMASAVPGPAAPYALAALGIAALSVLASAMIMGKVVGVRTLAQWLRALLAVALPLVATVVLLGLLPRGE
jgi:hypothetical protein